MKEIIAESGELHQTNDDIASTLTTQHGMPIADDQNILKVGEKGPALLEDMVFRDKIFHFDHERIPERVVHARGYGAHGFFETYHSLTEITKANLFQTEGEKTPVFVRFSTVVGNKGSQDLARDVRGFAVKFYTKEGNWDLVGNNIPVFFIQDPMKFPDLIHAAKETPDRAFPQAQTAHDNFWDFISLMPESMHMIMWIMSDRAIPRSFRFMQGFGVHTFRLINHNNKSTFVKFHWKPKLGLQSVVWNEAVKINGCDPDFLRRDLWDAIQSGNFPEWELGLQLFDESFVKNYPFDVLDSTKLIPEEDVPLQMVGRLVLDRCVDNFFAETEQVAFCTQNIIPGIDFTDDPLLQGRNFSYLDTQLKRLGSPNFNQLPINAPRCPVHFFQQDGHMTLNNPKGRVNYEPNSWDDSVRENPKKGFQSFSEDIKDNKTRARSASFADHYSQAKLFYESQTHIEQKHIQNALIFELSKVERVEIRERLVSHLQNINKELARHVAKGLGLEKVPAAIIPQYSADYKLEKAPSLSVLLNGPPSLKGRKFGILVTQDTDASFIRNIQTLLEKENVMSEIISSKIGKMSLNNGATLSAEKSIETSPSVLYDAVIIIASHSGIRDLVHLQAARDFLSDAFFHFKFIGYTPEVMPMFEIIGLKALLDEGCVNLSLNNVREFIEACKALRYWKREVLHSSNLSI